MTIRLGGVAILAVLVSACELLELPLDGMTMLPASTSTAAPGVDLSGQWEGEICYRPGYGYFRGGVLCNSITVVLQQEGAVLSGAFKEPDAIPDEMRGNSMPPYEPDAIIFSTLEGSVHQLEVSWIKTYDGTLLSGTQRFDGKASSDGRAIDGQWKLTRNFGSLKLRRVTSD